MRDIKETTKKSFHVVLLLLTIITVSSLLTVPAAASGDSGRDENMRATLINTAESLSQAIVELGQEEAEEQEEQEDMTSPSCVTGFQKINVPTVASRGRPPDPQK